MTDFAAESIQGVGGTVASLQEAIVGAEAAFIAVGTPPGEDGSADLRYVLTVAREIGETMTDYERDEFMRFHDNHWTD